jgi:hypothetical protein
MAWFVIPKVGTQRMASTLLRLYRHQQTAYNTDIKPKYQRIVRATAFSTAVEMMHDAGYGSTTAQIESIVSEVYRKDLPDNVSYESGNCAKWMVLADMLTEIHRV